MEKEPEDMSIGVVR